MAQVRRRVLQYLHIQHDSRLSERTECQCNFGIELLAVSTTALTRKVLCTTIRLLTTVEYCCKLTAQKSMFMYYQSPTTGSPTSSNNSFCCPEALPTCRNPFFHILTTANYHLVLSLHQLKLSALSICLKNKGQVFKYQISSIEFASL